MRATFVPIFCLRRILFAQALIIAHRRLRQTGVGHQQNQTGCDAPAHHRFGHVPLLAKGVATSHHVKHTG